MMSAPTRFALAFALVACSTVTAQELWTISFNDDRVDQPPSGFTLAAMRQSDAGRWLVQGPAGSGHLVHRSDPAASGFAIAVANSPVPDDSAVSARLRFTGASRVGGVVWRYRNDQNYYTLLLDLNRDELSVFRITEGNRVRLDIRDELELDTNAWHALKVVHVGNDIRVILGGVRVFDEQDRRSERSRDESGRVGVIATGASEIWFDDLHVETKRSHR